MADNTPITSVNSELISAGLNPSNPAQTYVDFASQLAKNQQEQAAQEQALALAKERVKQAQFQTQNQAPDSMTPEEARAYLQIIAQSKGLDISPEAIDAWVEQLPEHVNRQVVETFASRFARETTRSGQSFTATAEDAKSDKRDENGDALVAGQTYATLYDNQGNVQAYIRSGEKPADQSAKLEAKMGESAEKQWQKLDAAMNQFLKSTRGNQLSTAIIRSNRALNELANGEVLTPQVLSYVQKDLSGIFQGGVPPQAGMEGEDFTTTLQKVNGLIQRYTGVSGFLHTDLGNQRDYLLGLLSRLRESSVTMMKQMLSSEAAGYQGIVQNDPDRWTKMVTDKIAGATAGLSATAEEAVGARKMPTTVEKIPGVKKTGMALPSVSDIDAELARRK